jgi:hypothetical protein
VDDQRRYIGKYVLHQITRGLEPTFGFCVSHNLIVALDPKGEWRDYGNQCHYPRSAKYGSQQNCDVIPYSAGQIYSLIDTPAIPEMLRKVVKLREALDRQAENKAIEESRERQGTASTFTEDYDALNDPNAPENWQAAARKRKRELQHGPVTEGSRHYSFTE